ncbi:ABC1 family-domain containing protein [Nitzschia inconspicua]|uniref:ABC1 family-domain containing protein n=1 Tax=Nitzschia inconspicua TaxID=303405 RepID=A0A9K3PD91_9STRA|nr:ABC1 family-domain containing protein [Nitzschia inconspicua]
MRFSIGALSVYLWTVGIQQLIIIVPSTPANAFLTKSSFSTTQQQTVLNTRSSSSSSSSSSFSSSLNIKSNSAIDNDVAWKELTNKLSSTTIDQLAEPQSQQNQQIIDLKQISDQIDVMVASLKNFFDSVSTTNANDDNTPMNILSSDDAATANLQSILQSFQEALQQQQQQLLTITSSGNPSSATSATTILPPLFGDSVVSAKLSEILSTLSSLVPSLNTPETVLLSAAVSFWAITNILSFGQPPPPSKPYPLSTYDPLAAQAYFDQRPLLVLQRTLFIATKSLAFGLSLLQDKLTNQWETNMDQRGLELAELLTQLGPTFIKVGQSLSIRTDLLPPPYVRGLASLQDRVPAFDSTTAYQILMDEWDISDSIYDVVSEISQEPVAAASLGQVYKAKLKSDVLRDDDDDGTTIEVAIKVQRPDISTQIALDMHLLREAAKPAKRWFNLNTDTVGTVDAWGSGFVDELDYLQEARNAEYFREAILETPLKDVVFAPRVIDEFSTSKVLVTEWIDGERLDRSAKEDVTILCSIAMNTYLTMLLEMGILHCDPHPGNLLRTPDGKLCILDWGMVTSIPPQLQLTLIEHMAHLTSRDYEEVPRDLYLLGFVPQDKEKEVESSGVVDVLADIYGKWTDGGGMASINANEVLTKMQDLAAEKGNLFQIPPYFAYIAKSFSVLEGIGLSNDPQYSIIDECLPYVSNRLLTDTDTMGTALNTFIFGPDKNNIPERLLDAKRVQQLVTGYGSFSKAAASGSLLSAYGTDDTSTTTTEMLDKISDQVLDIVLTEEETPLQRILLEQLVKISTANARYFWTEARLQSGVLPNGRTLLGSIVDPLGLFQTSPLVNANEQDHKTVELTRKLIEIFSTLPSQQHQTNGSKAIDMQSLDRQEVIAFSRILTRKLWDRRDKLLKSSNRFLQQLLDLTAVRLETSERVPLPERQPTLGVTSRSTSSSKPQEKEELTGVMSVPKRFPEGSSAGGLTSTTASKRLDAARKQLNSLAE